MSMNAEAAAALVAAVRDEVRKVLVGQDEVLEQTLRALVAGGHVLVEGLPGLGKTLLVRAIAAAVGGESRRVQFTPDLMPSDLVGHTMYDISGGAFVTRKGPVFTHFLVADEINRAPAKTQAALLEVMQERQVSLDGATYVLDRPFLVLATQNPAEHEGTYPLPDAQLDRFLLKLKVDYPSEADEVVLVERALRGKRGDDLDLGALKAVADPARFREVQDACAEVAAVGQISEYAVRLAAATRNAPGVRVGAGPRAALALVRLARAQALMDGRDYAMPDDVKANALGVLRHRIVLDPEWELGGGSVEAAVERVVASVEAPRG